MGRHLPSCLGGFALVLMLSATTLAQSSTPSDAQLATARKDFRRGLELSDRGQWNLAISQFRKVMEVQPAPAVRFNLAYALSQARQLEEVGALVQSVLEDPETPSSVRKRTRDLEVRLARRNARLEVRQPDLRSGESVVLDGKPLALPFSVTTVFVRPGSHTLRIMKDGKTLSKTRLTAKRAEVHHVAFANVVTPTEESSQAASSGPPGSPVKDEGTKKKLVRDWRLWLGVGVALGAGVAAGFLIANRDDGNSSGPEPFEGNFTPGTVSW